MLSPLNFCDSLDCSHPGSSVPGDSPGKNTRVDCALPGDLPNPGLESMCLSPALQVDFFILRAIMEAPEAAKFL